MHENEVPKIDKPLRTNDLKDSTTEWYANFIDLSDADGSCFTDVGIFVIHGILERVT